MTNYEKVLGKKVVDKKSREFDILFDKLSTLLDGADIDAVIPALTLHLAAAAVCSNVSSDDILKFVSNTFKTTYTEAAKNLPTQGGVQ